MPINCPAYGPEGTNPPNDMDRTGVWSVNSGDVMQTTTKLTLPDGTPATPENSRVRFALSDSQFCETVIWEGQWMTGITPVTGAPGVVNIKLPQRIADSLRRGGYRYAIYVADKYGNNQRVVAQGGMLVEYTPGGPQHSIPYKDSAI